MAKRYTESNKWKNSWFRKLHPKYKLFWVYMLDQCDHAGLWEVDVELAAFQMGVKLNEKDLLEVFGDKIEVIKVDRWFIPKFIEYQYGELNESNRVHASVMRILEKQGSTKGRLRVVNEPIYKDKDKDKDILSNIKKNLDKRMESFSAAVFQHSDKYSKEVLQKFIDYWTETNRSKSKMRFEMEKTWDITKRLPRWDDKSIESKPKREEEFVYICPTGHPGIRKMKRGTTGVCPKCHEKLVLKESLDVKKMLS